MRASMLLARLLPPAKAVVRAKLATQRTLLMRSLRASEGRESSEACPRGSDEPAARDMLELLRRLDDAASVETILSLEGQGASLDFREIGLFLRVKPPGRGVDFQARTRRPRKTRSS